MAWRAALHYHGISFPDYFSNMLKWIIRQLTPIPGSLEFLWTAQCFVQNKWHLPFWQRLFGNPLPGLVRRWTSDLGQQKILTEIEPKHVLFITGGLNIIEHGLATMFALAHRNCEVHFVWLPNLQPDQPDDEYSKRKFKFYYRKALAAVPRSGRIVGIDMKSVSPTTPTEAMIVAAKAQACKDISYLRKRETIDVEGRDKLLYEWRVKQGTNELTRLTTLIARCPYDVIVIPNAAVLEFGAIYKFHKSLKIPIGNYEFWGGAGEAAIACGQNVMTIPTEELWSRNESKQLDMKKRGRVLEIMQQRRRTQRIGTDAGGLKARLALAPDAPIVLVCPNVPFDGVFLGDTTVFGSMRSWLAATIRHLLALQPRVNIVVRAHPHEPRYRPEETTLSILQEELGAEMQRMCIIRPEDDVSTYALMEIANLGLVFSSTTGLEMAVLGLPVVCGNLFHYNKKGFTYDPKSQKEYFEMIDKILLEPRLQRLSEAQIERAMIYLHIYLEEFPKPFPWGFEDLWSRLQEWPMERVMSPEGDEKFGRSFDELVGRKRE